MVFNAINYSIIVLYEYYYNIYLKLCTPKKIHSKHSKKFDGCTTSN